MRLNQMHLFSLRMSLRSIALGGLLAFAGLAESKAVKTHSGIVHGGQCSTTDIDYFYSIPYAKPPLGELRFAPPEPYNNSGRVINATTPAPACIQFGELFAETTATSEDCLFLDVWAPASATPKSNLPVKVWLYGGSNAVGGISDPTYNGCFSAADSIVVSINYRVGPLGYLALSDLGLTGNYGIMDQLLGLRWVQDNIAAFGGDPRKVLLFGQSAGALDASILATLPEAPQLMRAAALESGAGRDIVTVADAKVWYSEFLYAMNCTKQDLSCLRSAHVDGLRAAVAAMPSTSLITLNTALVNNGTRIAWTPVIDGKVIKDQPTTIGVRVPSILGSTTREGSLLVLASYTTTWKGEAPSLSDYDDFLTLNFGPLATRVNETFPLASTFNGSTLTAMEVMLTQVTYQCSSYRALQAAEKKGIPVWSYRFAHVPSCAWLGPIEADSIPSLGATHTSEIPFVFNFTSSMPPPNGNCTFSKAEQTMSHEMSRMWTNMAQMGVPDDTNTWPAWTSDESKGVVFSDAMDVGVVDYSTCDFWGEINEDLNEYWRSQSSHV
ncbi:alpha/beta-hydrolase [Daldinia vernicosa]|uniref:alpha/beta-hydrolase n=1 Tax=Daldinia vernicosa TaxID=114800 RepID=UPI002008CA8A|nr:alpha/beta-hydrolase [Daldinia vernicosa]KAI0844960.1 alpha/beta-hydrolase [Daldinia vernicosa]